MPKTPKKTSKVNVKNLKQKARKLTEKEKKNVTGGLIIPGPHFQTTIGGGGFHPIIANTIGGALNTVGGGLNTVGGGLANSIGGGLH